MNRNFFGVVERKSDGQKTTYQASLGRREPVEIFMDLDNWGYRVLEAKITEGEYQKIFGVAEVLT